LLSSKTHSRSVTPYILLPSHAPFPLLLCNTVQNLRATSLSSSLISTRLRFPALSSSSIYLQLGDLLVEGTLEASFALPCALLFINIFATSLVLRRPLSRRYARSLACASLSFPTQHVPPGDRSPWFTVTVTSMGSPPGPLLG
jgi:hypothetical protein